MTSVPDVGAVMTATVAMLRDVCPFDIGDGEAPDAESTEPDQRWGIVDYVGGGYSSGDVARPDSDRIVPVQLTGVGRTRVQAQWACQQMYLALMKRASPGFENAIDLDDGAVIERRWVSSGGTPHVETLFNCIEVVGLTVSV